MARQERAKEGNQFWRGKATIRGSGHTNEERGEGGHKDIQPTMSQSSNHFGVSGFISNADVEDLAQNNEKTELI